MPTRARAYSLPMVLMVLSTLSLGMTVVVFVLGASAKTTGAMRARREALYACDGIVRGLMVSSRSYFAKTPTPTSAGLQTHLCGATAACAPIAGWFDDFAIESVTATTGNVDRIEEVPTGPFRGSVARRTDITLEVTARQNASSNRCRVGQTAVNSQIGLFQFAVFSAMSMELFDAPTMDIRGRVHVNGDFTGGSGNPVTIEKLTASGRILARSDGFSIRDATDGTARSITSSNDGNEATWRTTSENTWHGNAQDVAWSVPALKLPAASTASTQGGNNASGTLKSNSGMLRILIDPPRSDDDPGTAAERLANKAAIRIVNGVWYKKNGSAWPGTPIWSDHPATYSPQDSEEVALVGSSALAGVPTSAAGPKRYSYYETDATTGLVVNDVTKSSIISWGALVKSGTTWAPGFFDGSAVVAAANDVNRVKGTRTGFVDGRVRRNSGSADANRGRMLPLNFDVGAFVEALQDTSAGELGSHFPTPLGENAIVWIGNTWPGWLSGFPDGAAGKPPAVSTDELASVPLPLCGTSGISGDLVTGVSRVACSGGSPALAGATAVRIWNAAAINPTVLPRGLTIVSNGPVYILGDTNTAALTGGVPGTPRAEVSTGNWVPLWVGGDAITLLSNNWSDAGRRWGTSTTPTASTTTYVVAVTGGHVERNGSSESGGVNNFPRFLEDWSGDTAAIHGSLVAGYRSVYQDQSFDCCGYYSPPIRTWLFDPNLAKPANQPPGTPSFFVQAIERWRRD